MLRHKSRRTGRKGRSGQQRPSDEQFTSPDHSIGPHTLKTWASRTVQCDKMAIQCYAEDWPEEDCSGKLGTALFKEKRGRKVFRGESDKNVHTLTLHFGVFRTPTFEDVSVRLSNCTFLFVGSLDHLE